MHTDRSYKSAIPSGVLSPAESNTHGKMMVGIKKAPEVVCANFEGGPLHHLKAIGGTP